MKKGLHIALIDILFYLLGAAIYSAAVTLFITPYEISPGGFTGIATVLNYVLDVPSGLALLALNIPVLILGLVSFGGVFILKTAAATVILSVTLEVAEGLLPPVSVDRVLACIFGGLMMGLGLSFFMLRGATSGGVDILAKFIRKRFPYFTVGRIILVFDAFVVMLAAVCYRNIESALYSVITIYASSRMMDVILYGSDQGKIVYVITDRAEEISERIVTAVKRGVTEMNVVGGYTREQKKMLMCTVRRHEVSTVLRLIARLDRDAFTVVAEAGEIIGNGFKRENDEK